MPAHRSPGLGPSKKNWSVDDFKNTLKIDNETYKQLYSSLEDEMQQYDLMFSQLREKKSQLLLQHTYDKIHRQFPHIFDQLSIELGKKCVMRLAQKCQYNFCRRRENQSYLKHDISESAEISGSDVPKPSPQPTLSTAQNYQQTLIIYDRRQRLDPPGHEYPYQLGDLMQHPIQTDANTLKNNLQFETIQNILKDDLSFDPASHAMALYQQNHILCIINDRTLRGALAQCGDGQLTIDIIPRSELEP
jgi:hypothetical protein